MKKSFIKKSLTILIFHFHLAVGNAIAAPIDLSAFSVIQYDTNIQPSNAIWTLGPGNTSATQGTNNEPSFFLGNFESSNKVIEADFRVDGSDNDVIGFVWGYQDFGDFYALNWWQLNNPDHSDKLILNVANTGTTDPFATSTFNTHVVPGALGWQRAVDYHFSLDLTTPGEMFFEITQGTTIVNSATIIDTTFTSGRFGFYTFSQANVTFSNLVATPIPPAFYLFGSGLLGLVGIARRKKVT